MKKLTVLLAVSALALGALFGCNDKKNEDKLVAQVGKSKIYESDISFMQRNMPYQFGKPEQKKAALDYLIESRLVYQAAEDLLGEDSLIEMRMKKMDDQLLARVYDDFFIAQNLGYSEKELRKFFNQNKKVLVADSCKSLDECRDFIAKKLFFRDHADEVNQYVNDKLAEENVWKANIMYVVSKDSAEAKKAEQDLKSRVPLSQIQGLEQEKFRADERVKITQDDTIYNLLFSKDSLPIDEVRLVRSGDSYVVIKVVLRRLPSEEPLTVRDSVWKNEFVSEFVMQRQNRGDSVLGIQYGLRYEPIINAEIQKYYDEHKAEFGGASVDNVASQIERKIFPQGEASLDSNYVLATLGGNPFITEKDVQIMRQGISPRFRNQYPRLRCRIILASWKLKAKILRDQKFENDGIVAKYRETVKLSFYRKALSSKLSALAFFVPEDSLKAVYDRMGAALFTTTPYERVRAELGIFLNTPDNVFRYEFYRMNPESKLVNLDSIKIATYPVSRKFLGESWFERFRRDLMKKFPVAVLDSAYLPWPDFFNTEELVARADSMHDARDLEGSRGIWIRIISLEAENDSLFARAAFEIATLDGELEKFKESDSEYAAFLAVWPDNENAEKALFSRGFQMHEYLKNDSLALPLLQSFQQKYPKSGMIESVNWLVSDIQSGGKLGEELLKKISEQEE